MTKALVVLSGGQDSVTCLAWAIQQYGVDNVHAVTFDYGQRHRIELDAAQEVAERAGIGARHSIVVLGESILAGSSPLTDKDTPLETYEDFDSMSETIGDRIEKTFVPGRNLLFLSIAANRAVVLGCNRIITGVCEEDGANYPDCTDNFIIAMEDTINWAIGNYAATTGTTEEKLAALLRIETPLMFKTKAETVKLALDTPGAYALLSYSHTAYDGQYPPTGKDHASILRAHGFEEAGIPDPLVLRACAWGVMDKPDAVSYETDKVRLAFQRLYADFTALGAVPEWVMEHVRETAR